MGPSPFHGDLDSVFSTDRGMLHLSACVEAMQAELGNEVGLTLDCGPGWTLPDAIRFARAVELLDLTWLEDMPTGDRVPPVNADVCAELTRSTSTAIHTGEQIDLRQNFKDDRAPGGPHRRARSR